MIRRKPQQDPYSWWLSLNHGGLLISTARLTEYFAETDGFLPPYWADRLRRDVTRWRNGDTGNLPSLMDTVLDGVIGLDKDKWLSQNAITADWRQKAITGEVIKPRRVWQPDKGVSLPVFVADGQMSGEARGKIVNRLGVGRGRRAVSRVVEWLRKTGHSLALLTNGQQWRLIHAGADYDAWCEWDIDLWFEEGQPGPQITALRLLLGQTALTTPEDTDQPPLLAAINASRQAQADISSILGERVRQAVELLIRESTQVINPLVEKVPGTSKSGEAEESSGVSSTGDLAVSHRDIYIAATRIVLRGVIILFAEARDLLPRDHLVYLSSYGLQGLREQLDRQGGSHNQDRLRHSYSAWPRLLALFRLISEGSHHPGLDLPRYGGVLFKPGDPDSDDAILRALAAFEDHTNTISDLTIQCILNLLCRTRVKVRQGRRFTWVEAPVDFSDLRSEYIGMLYEGLLDYELRRADDNDPMIFLNVGDQPVLPLARLENMDDKTITNLLDKLKDKSSSDSEAEEEALDLPEEEDSAETPEEETDTEQPGEESPPDEAEDQTAYYRERALNWAKKAVVTGKLVKKPTGNDPVKQKAYQQETDQKAQQLIARLILPGEWFLVRWGGTRKGSGTFYTRPQLAVPTVRRTLQPLIYSPFEGGPGDENSPFEGGQGDVVPGASDNVSQNAVLTLPKPPLDILNLKVCDPAMGSGSFLVAALNYLTDALYDSLFAHNWISEENGQLTLTNVPGTSQPTADNAAPASQSAGDIFTGDDTDHWFYRALQAMPLDAEDAESRVRSRLKRHIVENCLYGVDLDPLAVELARLSLWVETMDRRLPFEFLDHKLKCGNALVGCWFDRFQDYPALAWEREAGDKSHTGVHFKKEELTNRIKAVRNDQVKTELLSLITQQADLFQPTPVAPEQVHDHALTTYHQLHQAADHDREQTYAERYARHEAVQDLKHSFDRWCAAWFWPVDALSEPLSPLVFYQPEERSAAIVRRVAAHYRFFHWELEFPDVFSAPGSGFHAVIGNPPWEIMKPNSMEFFSNIDPLYRTYGKQEALAKQLDYFADPQIERDWLAYNADFKALSGWNKHAAFPFGDPDRDETQNFSLTRSTTQNKEAHNKWRALRRQRRGYADSAHPFQHQGSADINTYKMFLELAHALLQDDGRLGLIVPSGIYTDKGTTDLRVLFLNQCDWQWLFGFENRDGIFDIHRSFKFCPIIVRKGGQTEAIKAAFMERSLSAWEAVTPTVLRYPRAQVEQFSPFSKAILEVRSERDLQILQKMYANSVLLGDQGEDGWGIQYATEFHMTNDSKLFPPRPQWEAKGYQPDEYGHWLKGAWQPYDSDPDILQRPAGLILSRDGQQAIRISEVDDVALPLYEGRMIGQFDFSQKGWVSGKGRTAVWRDIPWENKVIEPQYLMSLKNFRENSGYRFDCPKVVFMDIGSATNSRTTYATFLQRIPCGHSAPVMMLNEQLDFKTSENEHVKSDIFDTLVFTSILNSFVYDSLIRVRMGGLHLTWHYLEETSLPRKDIVNFSNEFVYLSALLSLPNLRFSKEWISIKQLLSSHDDRNTHWALTKHERLRIRSIIDALAAYYYGLDELHYNGILKDCDHPKAKLSSNDFTRTLDPKGFWRVDKDKDPELRHTVLSLVAFHDLQEKGLTNFLSQNNGEGWHLPQTLRLSDYNLGHDHRAKESQPVASRLGPRHLPWQLSQTPAQSWEACARHAENLRLLLGDPEPARDSIFSKDGISTPPEGKAPKKQIDLFNKHEQGELF